MNDRQLRNIVDGLGGTDAGRAPGGRLRHHRGLRGHGGASAWPPTITDLKERLGRMVVAYTYDGKPVTAGDLKAAGRHDRPAEGRHSSPTWSRPWRAPLPSSTAAPLPTSPTAATPSWPPRLALKLGDYAVTEAGFGADLGAEKFLDIKCRMAGIHPDAVVVVATVRALKHHGGVRQGRPGHREPGSPGEAACPTCCATWRTSPRSTACPAWWPSTASPPDTEAELALVEAKCTRAGGQRGPLRGVGQGRRGRPWPWPRKWSACASSPTTSISPTSWTASIEEKLARPLSPRSTTATDVVLTPNAQKQAAQLTDLGYGNLPHLHGQDPVQLLGQRRPSWARPEGFTVTVRNLKVSAGAGFLVALTGDIMTMPGLPKVPAAEKIDVDEERTDRRPLLNTTYLRKKQPHRPCLGRYGCSFGG